MPAPVLDAVCPEGKGEQSQGEDWGELRMQRRQELRESALLWNIGQRLLVHWVPWRFVAPEELSLHCAHALRGRLVEGEHTNRVQTRSSKILTSKANLD